MDDITDHRVAGDPVEFGHRVRPESDHTTSLSISCDDCSMQCSAACDDCVVTFLVGQDTDASLILDLDQARVVRLLGKAGLVPDLKFRVAG